MPAGIDSEFNLSNTRAGRPARALLGLRAPLRDDARHPNGDWRRLVQLGGLSEARECAINTRALLPDSLIIAVRMP